MATEEEADGEGGVSEATPLRECLIVSEDQEVDLDYPLGVLLCEDRPSASCIGIAEIDGRFLCAFPERAWHKKTAKRELPLGTLAKAVAVIVPSCGQDSRDQPDHENTMRVWLGLISAATAELVDFSLMGDADLTFPVDSNGVQLYPFAESLVAAARDHFTFLSFSEGAGKAPVLEERLKVVEDALVKMQSSLDAALKARAAPEAAPGERPGRRIPARKKPALPTPLGLGLDPMVSQHALKAGVSPEALAELARLKVPENPVARKQGGGADALEVSSSDAEEVDDGADDGLADPMTKAVAQMSKVLKEMRNERKLSKAKTLDTILDRAESGSAKDSLNYGKSKAAALRSLQELLRTKPEMIFKELEKRLQEDWELNGVQPGLHASTVSARGWVEYRSKIQPYPSSIRASWAIAGIWDCLRSGKHDEARARAGLALAQIDQQSCDRGNWLLASELSLEPAPPAHSCQSHVPPESWETPHTKLIDPRWFELVLSKLKDYAEFQEKKLKLNAPGGKGKEQPAVAPAKPEPKRTPKGGGKDASKKGKTQAAEAGASSPAPATDA